MFFFQRDHSAFQNLKSLNFLFLWTTFCSFWLRIRILNCNRSANACLKLISRVTRRGVAVLQEERAPGAQPGRGQC
jgi:hypothetical protein